MGISIELIVDMTKVDGNRWEQAFGDAVKISQAGELADLVTRSYGGMNYTCLALSQPDEEGIQIRGDLRTGHNMEPQVFPRRLEREETGGDPAGDILGVGLPDPETLGVVTPPYTQVLGNKTQGCRGHIWLLAMACVFCDVFPEATCLGGDLTAGQVARALELAGEVLGRELAAPVSYDRDRLLSRVRRMAPGDEALTAKLFFLLYKGFREKEFNRFVVAHFSPDLLYAYFLERSHHADANSILREWLGLGLPFRDVARLLVADPGGSQMDPADFAAEVLMAKLHVEDKPLYNATVANNEHREPDDVGMQFSRAMGAFFGLKNRHIDCYIPLERLMEDCGTVFPNVEEVFSQAETKVAENQGYQMTCQFYEKLEREAAEAAEKDCYDLSRPGDLYDWDGSEWSVAPELMEGLTGLVSGVLDLAADSIQEFHALDRRGRARYLIELTGNRVGLTAALWDKMFENLMDSDFMDRYIGLLSVTAKSDEAAIARHALLCNIPLCEYIWKQTKYETPDTPSSWSCRGSDSSDGRYRFP